MKTESLQIRTLKSRRDNTLLTVGFSLRGFSIPLGMGRSVEKAILPQPLHSVGMQPNQHRSHPYGMRDWGMSLRFLPSDSSLRDEKVLSLRDIGKPCKGDTLLTVCFSLRMLSLRDSRILLCLMIMLFSICLQAQNRQTADSAYARPLMEVLTDIEHRFDIQLKLDKKMIDGKMLKYADWRIKPWSIDETLRAVLSPFDYTYVMDNGKYKIKEFEYARTNEKEGAKFLDYLKTLYADKASWEKRKAEIKACLPGALGLSPLPTQPASPVILTPKRKYDGYTVENFAIETLPGIYVAGSIYKPAIIKGKCPVMLNPNGHFGQGRYREDQQLRCASQARMGIISASWDLFAWGESLLQFDGSLHRLSAANTIQTLNAIRILDYLLSLKEADESRVGITGGSGGGSLTMMLAAIDDRITLSIPTVMLSSYFSGGCPCESGMPAHLCGGRTNNAEIASMFAPKPQLILSDGKDWTSAVPELEYPFVKRVYGFYQAENRLENDHFSAEGHDYGTSKRKSMYRFVAKHFNLNSEKADETKVTIEQEKQMYVFGEKGEKLPANAIHGKEALTEVLKKVEIY